MKHADALIGGTQWTELAGECYHAGITVLALPIATIKDVAAGVAGQAMNCGGTRTSRRVSP